MSDLHIELVNMGRDLRTAQAALNQVSSLAWDKLDSVDNARLDSAIGAIHRIAKRLEELTRPQEGAA